MAIEGTTIAVVVPAFNEELLILKTITTIPDFVDKVIVVDDASTDTTSDIVAGYDDPRVVLIRHENNIGVGGAIIDGHRAVLESGIDISVVMAGDAQMPPAYLESLVLPLIRGEADFTKGNRFFGGDSIEGMPKLRAAGSIVLSFLMKAASGYWHIFDPQNGYTAIHRRALTRIRLGEISKGYSFENSILIHLNIAGARVRDVEIPAHYGSEISTMRLVSVVPTILIDLCVGFLKRIHRKYVNPQLSVVGIFFYLGVIGLLLGTAIGAFAIWGSIGQQQASPGTAVLAVGGVLVGLQFSIAALIMDYFDSKPEKN